MKTMFKKNGKRVLSAALCLLMAVMSLPLSAFAWTSEEGRSCTSSFGDYYVGLDGEYYRSQATMHTLVYNDDGSTYVKSYSSGNAKRKYLMTDNSGTHQVYCVESGIDFNTGNTYTSKSGQNSSYFKNLPTDAQFGVMMALMYGWHEGKSSPVAGTNADDYAYATQSIIWEYQQQLRTSPADLHSANGIPADMYYSSIKGRPAEKCYNWILSQMADQLPASLAKLFVIKYAVTLADLDSIVSANYEAISLTKSGSSVANIKTKEYYLQNLFAAMLVPSGNDAAYVVADYCGGLLSPQAKNSQERINAFMEHLNDYLQEQGYDDTVLYDPSGFDTEARTTALDLKKVVESLLEYQWFRDIVSKSSYKATLPDESTQMWKNTNAFLDSTSDYYNGNVKGVKTGSLSDDYNLVVLYQQHGKEFLICSLGSKSNSSRYDDVNYIIKTIDESDYLSR